MLTNANNTVLYTGVTNDLERRCFEHKSKKIKGFTQKYNAERLIYYEIYDSIHNAIEREKQIKGYSRLKKNSMIDAFNQGWKDLYANGKIDMPAK